MRKIIMAAAVASAALALSTVRGEASTSDEPYTDDIQPGTCSISNGFDFHGAGSGGIEKELIGDGGSNALNEGWTDVGDGGSGIIHDGGTKVIGDGGGGSANGDGGSVG